MKNDESTEKKRKARTALYEGIELTSTEHVVVAMLVT